ncbi:MAG: hypothetical protein ISS36_03405 [Candidatus Aenigmarchaeota archaeon]|nr:hypothetical protein [Candidatus Aenigmarchaeota archaeon]
MKTDFSSDFRIKSYGIVDLEPPFELPAGKALMVINEYYTPQAPVVYGTVNSPSGKNVITGPCFLPSTDIKQMKGMESYDTSGAKQFYIECLKKAPTFQNIVCQGYPLTGNVVMVLETYEYGSFVGGKLDDDILEEVLKVAERTVAMCKRYQQMIDSEADFTYFYTHEPENNEMIDDIAFESMREYVSETRKKMGQRMKMRIEVTYMPEFAEQLFGPGEYTVAENFTHGTECVNGDIFKRKFEECFDDGSMNFLGLIPPISLGMEKREMDNKNPLYMGDPEVLSEQLQSMRNNGSGFYTSPMGILLMFTGDVELSERLYTLTEDKKAIKRGEETVTGLETMDQVRNGIGELEEEMFPVLREKLSIISGETL